MCVCVSLCAVPVLSTVFATALLCLTVLCVEGVGCIAFLSESSQPFVVAFDLHHHRIIRLPRLAYYPCGHRVHWWCHKRTVAHARRAFNASPETKIAIPCGLCRADVPQDENERFYNYEPDDVTYLRLGPSLLFIVWLVANWYRAWLSSSWGLRILSTVAVGVWYSLFSPVRDG